METEGVERKKGIAKNGYTPSPCVRKGRYQGENVLNQSIKKKKISSAPKGEGHTL